MATKYDFDIDYQHQLVGACFRIDGFLRTVYDCISAEWFTSEPLARLATACKFYYDKYQTSPTPSAMRAYIADLSKGEALSSEQAERLREVFDTCCSADLSDIHDIKERVGAFAQHQAMLSALIESADLLDAGDFDGVLRRVERARKVGLRSDLGLSFFHDERPPAVDRERIPTGLPTIDRKLRGGPGRGDGCVLIAPSGVGKSWALMAMALAALESGWDAVYYSLELSKLTADERFHMMTGSWRPREEDRKVARGKLFERLKTNLHIEFFPGGTVTVADLRRHFDMVCSEGKLRKEKTLIVVDYAELLKSNHQYNEGYMTARQKYLDLATWAQEDQLIAWTAQQTGREGDTAQRVNKSMVGDSWKIVCDYRVVMTLTSSLKDRQERKAHAVLEKATDSDGVDGTEVELTWHEGVRRIFEKHGSTSPTEFKTVTKRSS